MLGLGLLCVLVGCSVSHDPTGGGELAITKHENSTTASRGYVITNAVSDEPIKVGDWVYCYENGQREQGSYFEDQKEGVWTEWHDNGYAGRWCMNRRGANAGCRYGFPATSERAMPSTISRVHPRV